MDVTPDVNLGGESQKNLAGKLETDNSHDDGETIRKAIAAAAPTDI